MAQDQNALVWLDMEMTGLSPETDHIIELGDGGDQQQPRDHFRGADLGGTSERRGTGPDGRVESQYPWRTGLIQRVKDSILTEAMVEEQALDFMRRHVPKGTSPMCGNSICQDRRFMARYMPKLEDLVPLPQPRCVDAEGTVQALEARSGEGAQEAGQA
jgi:oligoribonuclease